MSSFFSTRGNPVTFAPDPPFFDGGALRSLYAALFVFVLFVLTFWITEASWRIVKRRNVETHPRPGVEMGTDVQGKPNAVRILHSFHEA